MSAGGVGDTGSAPRALSFQQCRGIRPLARRRCLRRDLPQHRRRRARASAAAAAAFVATCRYPPVGRRSFCTAAACCTAGPTTSTAPTKWSPWSSRRPPSSTSTRSSESRVSMPSMSVPTISRSAPVGRCPGQDARSPTRQGDPRGRSRRQPSQCRSRDPRPHRRASRGLRLMGLSPDHPGQRHRPAPQRDQPPGGRRAPERGAAKRRSPGSRRAPPDFGAEGCAQPSGWSGRVGGPLHGSVQLRPPVGEGIVVLGQALVSRSLEVDPGRGGRLPRAGLG